MKKSLHYLTLQISLIMSLSMDCKHSVSLLMLVGYTNQVITWALLYMFTADLESKKTSLLLSAVVHLLIRANKEECDYLKLTLELAKTIIEKGVCLQLYYSVL